MSSVEPADEFVSIFTKSLQQQSIWELSNPQNQVNGTKKNPTKTEVRKKWVFPRFPTNEQGDQQNGKEDLAANEV